MLTKLEPAVAPIVQKYTCIRRKIEIKNPKDTCSIALINIPLTPNNISGIIKGKKYSQPVITIIDKLI
ncbi:MAG: hypothetical protein K8S00_03420 [Bacteroidales bacterium]|nr:hypothetical protein [Bacteroidales bacterium]